MHSLKNVRHHLKENKLRSVRIIVTGKVQGVFFRKYTLMKANETGVQGFVKNLPDGNVHIEITGNENAVNDFIAWCYTGSPNAVVEKVEVLEMEPVIFRNFEIHY